MASILDLAREKRRQIYLLTLPVGALFVLLYVFIERAILPEASMWTALVAAGLLFIYFGILFVWPHSLVTVETLFFFLMALFFPVFAGLNLNNAVIVNRGIPEYSAEVINGMTLWEVIFFVAAFLVLPPKTLRNLILMVFLAMLVVASTNIGLLHFHGPWNPVFAFHWFHCLFALAVTTFLIFRIGRLQQIYATMDLLTGVLNRREALNILQEEYERAARYKIPFSVILIDIDYFKRVNDTFGHVVGDRVLKGFAGTLSGVTRAMDRVARWGGEEFLIILPSLALESSRLTAERIRELICCTEYDRVQDLTASMGVASHWPGESLDDLLTRADEALYLAKNQGRNRVVALEYGVKS